MRLAGTLEDESRARCLVDYLLTVGIDARAERSTDGWAVWVYDENQLDRSKQELAEFIQNPEHERYATASQAAEGRRRDAARATRKARKNLIEVRQMWERPALRSHPVTYTITALAILVAIATGLGQRLGPPTTWLTIKPMEVEDGSVVWRGRDLHEVKRGEVWRLFTPALLHFGPLHLLFNLYWLHVLGGMIERRQGSLFLLALILASALTSNVAQFYGVGPYFGGLSGVIAGLFGYVWMKTYFDPSEGYFLHPNTVFFMLACMLLATTGALGPVANYAHGAGLLTGVIWGAASFRIRR